MSGFEYVRTNTLEEATRRFAESEDARYLAGGQSLLPLVKMRLASPSLLIDLRHIPALGRISRAKDDLVIGAMACHADVAASAVVGATVPALAKLAESIGDVQVRNWGTIGGSLAHGDPAADYAAAALGLGATIVTDRRSIEADDFFKGIYETALDAGEVVREVRFPIPKRAGYAKLRNPASGYPIVGVFVADTKDGVRVGVTGARPSPFRLADAELALRTSFAASVLGNLFVDALGMNDDLHADGAYRAHLTGILTRRAVAAAF